MAKKLWQKSALQIEDVIDKFNVGDDYIYDNHLAPFDIYGNVAHLQMLHKIGIVSSEEQTLMKASLKKIMEKILKNEFQMEREDEDIHTKVENQLVQDIGDAGKKIHTARSRNDQVLLDIRLYSKSKLLLLSLDILGLSALILDFAKKYEFMPMPGYTHMQIAMPSSVGMWASSFVENMIDELVLLKAVFTLNDMNPLGSGAGYGVSIDIDRKFTSELLGFNKIQENCIYCANSRGKVEANILSMISSYGLIFNRIASDLLLFTTKEFGFFNFSEKVATGSSIMPQKKNLDVMELVRSRTKMLVAYEHQMKEIISNLPSGYNRDYQDTKKILMDAIESFQEIIAVMKIVFKDIKPNVSQLNEAFSPEIFAADEAYKLVKNGVPFRDAYKQIGQNLDKIKGIDPAENIKAKSHIGSTGNLQLEEYSEEIDELTDFWKQKCKEFEEILTKLM